MSESAARPSTAAAITLTFFCVVVTVASGIRLTGNLNGRVGFVFFLLVMVTPFFIATGAAVTVWRLMVNRAVSALTGSRGAIRAT